VTNELNRKIEEIIQEELQDLLHISSVFSENCHRSLKLLRFSFRSNAQIEDKEAFLAYMYDVARATVVFLHSSIETMLREIVRLRLKQDVDISYIPLSGQLGFANRRDKFTLGDLAKHRGKTVEMVIEESIDDYLSSLSFNSIKDITDTFTRIKLPQITMGKYYPSLEQMIFRRHQIVHEADMKRGSHSMNLEPISIEQIGSWVESAAEFCAEVIRVIVDTVYVDKIVDRMKAMGFQVKRDNIARAIHISVSTGE
jgi:hypothetical protein